MPEIKTQILNKNKDISCFQVQIKNKYLSCFLAPDWKERKKER